MMPGGIFSSRFRQLPLDINIVIKAVSYAFIATHAGEFPVRRTCQVLGVSSSGYYDWLKRPPSQRQQANEKLLWAIRRAHEASRQTYGSLRIHAALKQQGVQIGRKRPVTTQRAAGALEAPNLLAQYFTTSQVSSGWLYLALVMDLFSRAIVGWSMADHLQAVLGEQTLGRRLPDPGLLHHSDQGSQYTSALIQTLLAQQHITVSMSGLCNCYDNAPMESLIGTLKTKYVTDQFATRAEARQVIFDYIEVWYNRQRLHSSLVNS